MTGDQVAVGSALDPAALSKLVCQPVKLRLTLQNAALFSYWWQ